MTAIPPVHNTASIAPPTEGLSLKSGGNSVGVSDATGANPFEQLLAKTSEDQKLSDKAIQDLVAGNTDNVQQVVMQVVKSEMSFQLFMEVRNQLIESYNQLMRMQF